MWPRSDDEVVTGGWEDIGGVIELDDVGGGSDDGERRVVGSDLKLVTDWFVLVLGMGADVLA